MRIIIILLSLLCTSNAFAWTRTIDFDTGSPGASATSQYPNANAGTATLLSTQQAKNGSMSAEMYFTAGSTGVEEDYVSIGADADVPEGSGAWVRAYYYFGTRGSWSWTGQNLEAADSIKTLRHNTSGGGFISIILSTGVGEVQIAGVVGGEIMPSNECPDAYDNQLPVKDNPYNEISVTQGQSTVPSGQWVCLEQYVYSHATNGVHRIWLDGVLVYQRTGNRTVPPGGSMRWMNAMGYTNQGFAASQYMAVDAIVFTTDTPSARDTYGNPMVGPIGWGGTDTTAPVAATKTIASSGTTLTLAFNETVSIGSGGNGGWAISPSGGTATLSYASGSGTSSLVYNISRPIQFNETMTVSYTQPGNGVEDTAGNDLVTFSGSSVTNSSTQGQDLTSPICTITTIDGSSNTSATYATSSSTLNISGTATDAVGVTQVQIEWTEGGVPRAELCTGTTSWAAPTIALYSGITVFTVRAYDAANNQGTDTLTVTYSPVVSDTPATMRGVTLRGVRR